MILHGFLEKISCVPMLACLEYMSSLNYPNLLRIKDVLHIKAGYLIEETASLQCIRRPLADFPVFEDFSGPFAPVLILTIPRTTSVLLFYGLFALKT